MTISTSSIPVQVTRRGNVGSGTVPYVRRKVRRALGVGREPVRYARVMVVT